MTFCAPTADSNVDVDVVVMVFPYNIMIFISRVSASTSASKLV